LLAAIALTLSATALDSLPVLGTVFSFVLPFVVVFVAGATIVVALKELFQTARKDSPHINNQRCKSRWQIAACFCCEDIRKDTLNLPPFNY
jgi:zinc transporter ZupT